MATNDAEATNTSSTRLQDKFRGTMVGAVIGDALGAPLEFISNERLPHDLVRQHFRKYREASAKRPEVKRQYTDDTAMARQVAESLLASQGRLDAKDMAARFVDEFYREPHRGYGPGTIDVFKRLRATECSDPFLPAKEQFQGKGSYGNGGAMRVHPVSLFAHGKDLATLVELAAGSAKITHANRQGYKGAVMQACAVRLALEEADDGNFLSSLGSLMADDDDDFAKSVTLVEKCLADDKAAADLGNDVSAIEAVPTAIYSFLRARSGPIQDLDDEEEEEDKGNAANAIFERTLRLAYSFGGDTDTIGSMAGALAGAFVGWSGIPEDLRSQCEGADEALAQADKIFHLVVRDDSGKTTPAAAAAAAVVKQQEEERPKL